MAVCYVQENNESFSVPYEPKSIISSIISPKDMSKLSYNFKDEINLYNNGIKLHNVGYNITGIKSFVKKYKGTIMEGKYYLKEIKLNHPKITIDESIVSGMPVISGRRITVSLILACLRDGMSIKEIAEDYELSNEDVISSLEYCIDLLNRPFYEE